MQDYPTLENPPIVEAVLDIRVFKESPIDPNKFSNLEGVIGDDYVGKKTISLFEAKLPAANQVGPEGKPEFSNLVHGYRYETAKDHFQFLAMLRVDGMALSLLGEYSSWERLFEEAQRLWGIYFSSVQPDGIVRLGTRFINRINLSGRTHSDVFTAPVPKPGKVGGRLESLQVVSKYSYSDYETPIKAILRHTLEEFDNTESSAIIDIDAFVELTGDNEQPAHGKLTSVESFLDSLRAVKNDLFFKSLTEEAIQSFIPNRS